MENYTLAQSFNKANIQDRTFYAMTESAKAQILADNKAIFGDKVWVIATQTLYILGNDSAWHEM